MESNEQQTTSCIAENKFSKRAGLLILVFLIISLLNLGVNSLLNTLSHAFLWEAKEVVLSNGIINMIMAFSVFLLPFAVPQKGMRITVFILCAVYIISVISMNIMRFIDIFARF